jgi:hypothetical protein
MNTNSIHVKRTATVLRPDQSRVLLRPFRHDDPERSRRIIARIMSLQKTKSGHSWTKYPLNSPSDTSKSTDPFWNGSNRSATSY